MEDVASVGTVMAFVEYNPHCGNMLTNIGLSTSRMESKGTQRRLQDPERQRHSGDVRIGLGCL